MKKRVIKIVVLVAVFIFAVMGFSAYMNQGDTDMTADMDGATLPTISFEKSGYEVNMLVGHKNEMQMTRMRDSILPCETGSIAGYLNAFSTVVEAMSHELYTIDGKELLQEGPIDLVENGFVIPLGEGLEAGQEGILKLALTMEDETTAYYYTRVVKDAEFHVDYCIDYVMDLHNAIISKTETAALKKGLESNSEGDNTTLQHVTIHSDIQHVLWDGLTPEVVSELGVEIKEVNKAYTSVLLEYQVTCAGDNNESELYSVKEFFKVTYKNGSFYLMGYDRKMTEVFNPNNLVLSSKGIILGITDENIPFKANNDGTMVAFVVERDLWCYNKEEDEFSLVFSFSSSENTDSRHYHDEHGVRILSMDEEGNMTFSVYGYMNRGNHEGESGLSIFYFNIGTNSIEEKAFIRSTEPCYVIEEELNKLAFYNSEQDILYILVENDLFKINLTDDTQELMVENLLKEQYVTSEEGHMIAYQTAPDSNVAEVWNFAKDKKMTVKVAEEEIIVPLGFVGEDFVYGVTREADKGYDSSGQTIRPMYMLEIQNSKNEILKTYTADNTYIFNVVIKDNMITLTRAVKTGNTYQNISDDYITNNEESAGVVALKSYWTEMKQTQYRLLFDEGIENTKTRMLSPKFTLYESLLTFDSQVSEGKYYYVYGYGELAGRFENAADAVALADKLSGVVVTPEQRYAWEDGNRVAWYRNFNIGRFVAAEGENSLEACVRKVLAYEKAEGVDVKVEMSSKSIEDIFTEHIDGEGIRFRDGSCKDLFYLIDKGIPAIGLKDSSSAVLLIGYDALNVTYVDVASGSIRSCSIEKMDEMTAGSGNTYISYVK